MNRNLNVQKVDYSTFDLSHVHKTSLDMGHLIPITWKPMLPGDKFEINVSNFIRAMPTKVPLVDGIDLKSIIFTSHIDVYGWVLNNLLPSLTMVESIPKLCLW